MVALSKNKISGPYRVVFFMLAGLLACSLTAFGFLHAKEKSFINERENSIAFTGAIEADEVMVSFKIPGKIASLLVNEGDPVKKGQAIAQLETDELEVKVAEARAAVEAARAQVAKAQNSVGLQSGISSSQIDQAQAAVEQAEASYTAVSATWERIQQLYSAGAVSTQQKDEAEAQYKTSRGKLDEARAALNKAVSSRAQVTLSQNDVSAAQAQLALAQAKYDEAMVYLKNATLVSPMDGTVTLKAMKQGEMVGAGTPVIKVTDIQNTWVKVYVTEKKVGRIKLGQKVKVAVQSYPDQAFEGVVCWINAAGEFATQKAVNDQYQKDIRSFEVKVQIPNPDLRLRTGMTATVSFGEGD